MAVADPCRAPFGRELDRLTAFRFHPLDLFVMRVGTLAPLGCANLRPCAKLLKSTND
jgi:hypothetical protein